MSGPWKYHCELCGNINFSSSHISKYCKKCRSGLGLRILRKWNSASICICCGEVNPLILLPIGHHIFGAENSDVAIPICANCHELTKPRSAQTFFLFEDWVFPKSKFSQDNSKFYVEVI